MDQNLDLFDFLLAEAKKAGSGFAIALISEAKKDYEAKKAGSEASRI